MVFVPGDRCIVAVDASLAPADSALPVESILVTAEAVTVQPRTHSP